MHKSALILLCFIVLGFLNSNIVHASGLLAYTFQFSISTESKTPAGEIDIFLCRDKQPSTPNFRLIGAKNVYEVPYGDSYGDFSLFSVCRWAYAVVRFYDDPDIKIRAKSFNNWDEVGINRFERKLEAGANRLSLFIPGKIKRFLHVLFFSLDLGEKGFEKETTITIFAKMAEEGKLSSASMSLARAEKALAKGLSENESKDLKWAYARLWVLQRHFPDLSIMGTESVNLGTAEEIFEVIKDSELQEILGIRPKASVCQPTIQAQTNQPPVQTGWKIRLSGVYSGGTFELWYQNHSWSEIPVCPPLVIPNPPEGKTCLWVGPFNLPDGNYTMTWNGISVKFDVVGGRDVTLVAPQGR